MDSGGLLRPRMHHGGQGRLPVRAIRTTTISILAVGLLGGSTIGVAAQDDAAFPTDEIIYVTGEMSSPPEDFKGADDAKVEDVVGGFRFENAITWDVGLEFTDPRLSGKLRIVQNGIIRAGRYLKEHVEPHVENITTREKWLESTHKLRDVDRYFFASFLLMFFLFYAAGAGTAIGSLADNWPEH